MKSIANHKARRMGLVVHHIDCRPIVYIVYITIGLTDLLLFQRKTLAIVRFFFLPAVLAQSVGSIPTCPPNSYGPHLGRLGMASEIFKRTLVKYRYMCALAIEHILVAAK